MKSITIAAGLFLAGVIGYSVAAHAQPASAKADPVKVDPKHYKVEFENESVRVLRISYGPGEKSVMHNHPNAVAVYLTDGMTRMTTPDYSPNFRLSLMAKDLTYAIQESEKISVHLATAQAALSSFRVAIDNGLGEKDIAAVVEPVRNEIYKLSS